MPISSTLDSRVVSIATGCNSVRAVQWTPALWTAMTRFKINTPLRQAAFLSQLGHESAGLSVLEENLNYSKDGLRRIFGKYFPTDSIAAQYARQPQKIANLVYANRMGNGPESSGDGWKFRGRGPLQVTGKDNYTWLSKEIGIDLLSDPGKLCDPLIGSAAAGLFWTRNNINEFADKGDFDGVCDKVNLGRKTEKIGDAIGYAHRKALYDAALKALA